MRKDVDKHLKTECYLRRYKCEHCNHEDTYEAITGEGVQFSLVRIRRAPWHYDTCPMIPSNCPNRCGALGIRRKDMSNHRELCPLEPLECPNRCRVHGRTFWGLPHEITINRINRKDLSEHLRGECYLRRHKCEHCGHDDTYQAITGKGGPKQVTSYHYTTCPDLPLECPKKCGAARIKRKDIPAHREQCPLDPVQCPFQEAGCETKLVRRDLGDHMATQTQQHLLLAFRMLRQENAELKQEVQALKAKSA